MSLHQYQHKNDINRFATFDFGRNIDDFGQNFEQHDAGTGAIDGLTS